MATTTSEAEARGVTPYRAAREFHDWLWFQCWRPDAVGDLARAQHYGIPWPAPVPSLDTANHVYVRAVDEYQAFYQRMHPKPTPTRGDDAQEPQEAA